MAKLPGNYREILLLKYYLGYNNREIAQMLNLTEYNVKKLEQRAKRKLREICDEEGML